MLRWGRSWQRLTAARRAARAGAWQVAAQEYAAFLDVRPGNAPAWVQFGHAHKALGDLPAARAAYERALAINPGVADIWLQLAGVLRRQGDRPAAIDCCVRAVSIAPNLEAATEELLALGGRDRLPGGVSHHHVDETPAGSPPWLAELAETQNGDVYAISQYSAYRLALKILCPPATPRPDQPITVVVDARTALPVDVRATLSSLLDQADAAWTATVIASALIRDHSVASLAAIDPRIRFAETGLPDTNYLLLTRAGTVLDRQAVGWFGYTAARTGCAAAYSDHDHCVDDWRSGRTHRAPLFQPMHDPDWFADPMMCPALVLADPTRVSILLDSPHEMLRTARGEVAHIPQLLGSVKAMSPQAEQAQVEPVTPPALKSPMVAKSPVVQGRIQVIIQTRDAPELLRDAVDSLHRLAARPDALAITIVDNRSILPATDRLLARYAASGIATTLSLDEPFNWSRANNLAAAGETAPLLVFLNNDTTSLTRGWDTELYRSFADSGVGALGAMLLYPDRSIQHAGMIFGMGSGGPMHEGVGHGSDAVGPNGRWVRTRAAAAVTGAFLAVRRTVFERVGGFDAAGLSIAFNDVDLCLRIREAGYRVIQTPEIRLTHHESKTRGINVTRSQVAWDLEELAVVHRRWGAALFEDPGYNPHWTRVGQPFDGFRFPGIQEVLRHIDRSARANPWAARSGSAADWW